MNTGCLKSMTSIYKKSSVPVVIFSESMDIAWYNKSFSDYFPGIQLRKANMPALARTPLKSKINAAAGHSGRFHLVFSSEERISSSVVMLVFPLDKSDKNPSAYIGYVDDLTKDRNMMLRKTYLGLLEASKLKDDDTGYHIKRVGAYARCLCEECYTRQLFSSIDPDFIESIHFLAPMHDVGKIGTPDEILTKRGALDDNEWSIMKQHTINGALILSNYPDSMASEIARGHHEKWDGSGYIYGLAGEDIPLSARITAIADVYDALRMKRSYKEAFSHAKTMDIMLGDSGKHFDPALIDVFESINGSFENIYDTLSDDTAGTGVPEIEELPAAFEESLSEDEDITELEEV